VGSIHAASRPLVACTSGERPRLPGPLIERRRPGPRRRSRGPRTRGRSSGHPHGTPVLAGRLRQSL